MLIKCVYICLVERMEMMNNKFYNRMINSTKKLFEAEPQNKQIKEESSFGTISPSIQLKSNKKVSKRHCSHSKNFKRQPASRINKVNYIFILNLLGKITWNENNEYSNVCKFWQRK